MSEIDADNPEGSDTTTTANANAGDAQGDSGAGDQQPSGDAPTGKEPREARYRRERNESRAEVERLAGVVQAMQQREVDRIVEGEGLKPKAFAAAGVELADLLGDDGTVDVEKVTAAVGVAREELGIEAPGPRPPKAAPTQGQFGRDGGGSDDWAAAFAPSAE